MNKNRFLLIMALSACVGGAASLSVASATDLKAMVGAETNTQWTLAFDSSKGELRKIDSSSYSKAGMTTSGTPVYLYSLTGASNFTVSSDYVAGFQSKFDEGQAGAGLLSFSSSNTSDVPFRFQNIKSIYAKTTRSLNNLVVQTSTDGSNWTSLATAFNVTASGATYTLEEEANYVRIKTSDAPLFAVCFEEVSVQYECGQATHTLSSLSVDSSNAKTSFEVGEEFDYEGLIAKAIYQDGIEIDVTDDMVVTAPDMSTEGDKEVVCSYTEGGITVEDRYVITVSQEHGFDGVGKYALGISWFLELNDDFTGSYEYQGAAKLYITYAVDGGSVVIALDETKQNDPNESFGNNRIFPAGTTRNASGVYDASTKSIKITTYNAFGTGTIKTFSFVE